MQLKTYRSATVREALAQARAELGPQAVVVSTRLVAVDGVRGMMGAREVEVTAARDAAAAAGMSESRPAARGADTRPASQTGRPARAAQGAAAWSTHPATSRTTAVAAAAAAAAVRRDTVTAARPGLSAGPRRVAAAGQRHATAAYAASLKTAPAAATALAEPRWATADDDEPLAANGGVEVGARASGPIPWEYRDEPLTGASRWLIEEPPVRDAQIEALISRLCATGLHRDLAEGVALHVPAAHRRNGSVALLERAIAAHLADLAAGDEPYAAVELFVGPPGAGKTTTIAKIAAQERARRGAKLSLLAADGFRVGAVEQLRIYADIIGTPFAVARTPQEIERSLLTTRGTVLVDTAGRSAHDPRAQEVLAMLAGLPGVRTHLVVAAATPVRDFHRLLDAYGRRRPNRVVLTRVDEAESVSPLMHIFRERGLTLSYLGTGQRVPEDLERATPDRLAAHVLGHGLPEGLPA